MRRVTPELKLIQGLGRRSASGLAMARQQLRPLLPDIARLLREEAMLDRELAARVASAGRRDAKQLKKLREHCAIRCSTLLAMTQYQPEKRKKQDMLTMIPTLDAPEITARIELRGWLAGLSSAYARAERRANAEGLQLEAMKIGAMQLLVSEDIVSLTSKKEKRA